MVVVIVRCRDRVRDGMGIGIVATTRSDIEWPWYFTVIRGLTLNALSTWSDIDCPWYFTVAYRAFVKTMSTMFVLQVYRCVWRVFMFHWFSVIDSPGTHYHSHSTLAITLTLNLTVTLIIRVTQPSPSPWLWFFISRAVSMCDLHRRGHLTPTLTLTLILGSRLCVVYTDVAKPNPNPNPNLNPNPRGTSMCGVYRRGQKQHRGTLAWTKH